MRHPENAAEVRASRPVTRAADVPRMEELYGRVHLQTLGRTEPGDVFYLLAQPSLVWENCPIDNDDAYRFITTGVDCWRRSAAVGTGDPGQLVVVLHNTRKYKTPDPPAC